MIMMITMIKMIIMIMTIIMPMMSVIITDQGWIIYDDQICKIGDDYGDDGDYDFIDDDNGDNDDNDDDGDTDVIEALGYEANVRSKLLLILFHPSLAEKLPAFKFVFVAVFVSVYCICLSTTVFVSFN